MPNKILCPALLLCFACSAFSGCQDKQDRNPNERHREQSEYSLSDVYSGDSSIAFVDGKRFNLIEIKSKKSGKTYLIACHEEYNSESMIKLDEWTTGATENVK